MMQESGSIWWDYLLFHFLLQGGWLLLGIRRTDLARGMKSGCLLENSIGPGQPAPATFHAEIFIVSPTSTSLYDLSRCDTHLAWQRKHIWPVRGDPDDLKDSVFALLQHGVQDGKAHSSADLELQGCPVESALLLQGPALP